jgi:hypothetical protein
VIDAINQINAPNLRWLPTRLPPHVCCVLSALPSPEETWLVKRDIDKYEVPVLNYETREELTRGYLDLYRKKLSPKQLEHIVSAHPCENQQFLTTILAELVIFGSFEQRDAYISHLVSSRDLSDLFDKILSRFERDYGLDLTRDLLSALWASLRGLSATEIMEITSRPLVEQSKVLLALEHHLKAPNGFTDFAHTFLRTAAQERYLGSDQLIRDQHHKLAKWFRTALGHKSKPIIF